MKNALHLPEISKLLAKGRKLVGYFHKSTSVSDLLAEKQLIVMPPETRGHKLIQDCPTRWNSVYEMSERLIEQTPAITAVVDKYS